METPPWGALLSRIVPQDADDLGELTARYDPRHRRQGRDVFPDCAEFVQLPGAFKREETICVGLRVLAPLKDAYDRAMRLAAFAAEQDVEIVVLAHTDVTGLERFGFRIERIAGATPQDRDRCEQQILRFWSIDLVL
ncbi:MAG TPA: hypothetical protein VM891_01820 [Amaricoccus sp.]|nr:hypothetical protein [Amaricoccus sp.]